MRVFLAIPLGERVNSALDAWYETACAGLGLRKVPAQNRHVTLHFFGDVSDEELAIIKKKVEEQRRMNLLPDDGLAVTGIGVFSGSKAPVILWAGVEDRTGWLAGYVASLDQGLARSGFARPQMAWQPHITLARTRSPSRIELAELCSANKTVQFGTIYPVRVVLYQSTLFPEGPRYDVLEIFKG